MILGKRLRAPNSSWGQWGKWIVTLFLLLIFTITSPLMAKATEYIDADKSNWPQELKDKYQGARIYNYTTNRWTYDKDKIQVVQDDYMSNDNHYIYVWDQVIDSMYYDISDKLSDSWIGTPEYDANTNIFRIRYHIKSTGLNAYNGALIHPLFDTSSFWINPYQHRDSYSGICRDLNLNTWNQKNAIPDISFSSKEFFTFNGTRAPSYIDYEGHTSSLSSYIKFYNLATGIWWTYDYSIKNYYRPYQVAETQDSDVEGYIYIGNIPKGQSITFAIYPFTGYENDSNTIDHRYFYHNWGSGSNRFTLSSHTHNLNITHWDNAGQRIDNGYAQHQIHRWYSCDANDGYSQEGDYYWENCYDADDNGYCDVCGRHRRWVNINVNTPDGKEDTSGNTARFNMSWHDNTALGGQQDHWEGQVSDQKNGNVWVGTTIWIDNINISQSYLYLTGVSGATQNGSSYYYEVQDEEHTININTDYKSYNLTINPNGGTLNVTDGSIKKNSNGTATATVKYNQTWYCDLGVTASREHYIMDGFYTSASGGTKLWDNGGTCYAGNGYWNSSRKWCYAGDVTVYAHWSDAPGYHNGKAIVYTITYTLYPKNGSNIGIKVPNNPTTYTIETPTFNLVNPDNTNGYKFEGWYGSGTNGSKGVTIKQGSIGDLHFEADWLPTKDSSKGDGHDQNLPYVKTTEIKENKVKIAA